MTQSWPVDLADQLGIGGVTAVAALRAGLGGNELWRLSRPEGDLVVRAFPPGAPPYLAEREQQAHAFAADHGIPAPAVHSCQVLDGRSYLVMDHVPGERLADALWRGDDPDDLGRRSGATLAALHRIADPAPAVIARRSWLDWPEAMPGLRPLLEPYDTGRVTLHLDFHPENLIISPDGRIIVLDWANCVVGPPAADLARTLAILELILVAVPELTEIARRTVERYREAFLAGYSEAGGDPSIPDAVRAWAYAGQRRDMAGSWVAPWYLDRLEQRCRELIGTQNIP
jgi:aminoglycoside phosphotransferase (APT) family kinase protein